MILGLTGFRLFGALAVPLLIIAAIGGLAWSRANWIDRYEVLSGHAGNILYEVRVATGNKKLRLEDAAGEVRRLAASRKEWKDAAEEQTAVIDRMAFDTKRMQQLNAELRAKAEVELRKRKAAYEQLDARARDPGNRADCIAQIKAAEAALDEIYEAGL